MEIKSSFLVKICPTNGGRISNVSSQTHFRQILPTHAARSELLAVPISQTYFDKQTFRSYQAIVDHPRPQKNSYIVVVNRPRSRHVRDRHIQILRPNKFGQY